MAPFGKLYGYEGNPRTRGLQVIAKENHLDVELVHTNPGVDGVTDDYRKINKLGRIPSFEGADGYVLNEMIAIAVYLTSQNEKTTLLGKTKQDYASILRWLSFANSEVLVPMGGWFRPLQGKDPYNKKNVEDSQKRSNESFKVMEDHLMINTFLVGERISLADIVAAGIVGRGMELVLDKAWRTEHPSVTRWFETVVNQSNYKSVAGEPKFAAEAIKYTPPVKEKAPKQEPKKQEPKAAKKKDVEEDEEEEDKPAPKPKHPIEELPKSSVPIDEWKRKFKNEETREVALPWFWENMPLGEEFTIWSLDYKYPEELTQVFMTSNLVSGLFTRLEGSRKYIQGCASVFGENNDSVIRGAFVIRGKDHVPAFDVAPDWESYEFKQLDPKDPADKKFFEDMMSWDQPVMVKGKEYQFQDGKIFV